jgi:hypothetical protein
MQWAELGNKALHLVLVICVLKRVDSRYGVLLGLPKRIASLLRGQLSRRAEVAIL